MKKISSIAIVLLVVLSALLPQAGASISPATLEATLRPGESITETKTVEIPEVPARADVLFAFDLTGSMYGIISTAKSQSGNIMTALDATGVDINYGVVSYMDYPGAYNSFGYFATYGSYPCGGGDYAYRLDSPITNDRTAVSDAINALIIGCGADGPQDYTRIMYESYADPAVSWRPGAKKILLNFADDVPHDNNLYEGVPGYSGTYTTGGDPGRNEIMDETTDPSNIGVGNDDLNLQTVLAEMAANNVIMLESHTYAAGFMFDAWTYWTGITGGQLFTTSSATLPDDVVSKVTEVLTSPTVDNVHLAASPGYESWISSPESYSGPTGVTQTFTVTITVPAGTPAGDYNFKISAVDSSGVSYGDQDVTIHVIVNNPPVITSLAAAPSGPVQLGTPISLDSTWTDDAGDTFTLDIAWGDGITETKSVGTATSDSTPHTYADPGVYTITLKVTDNGGLYDTESTADYVVIYDPSAGFVTGGGWIESPAGAMPANPTATGKANFGFVSKYQKGAKIPTGVTQFVFHAGDLNFHSDVYEWLVVAGQKAMYKGTGNINDGPELYKFILSAIDSDAGDKFRIRITDTADNVIYDNQIGDIETADPTTAISDGSIIIHTGKK